MRFENIRNLREDHDKLQIELAAYLNVKQTTYSKYELGKINIPVEVLIKLSDFYEVSLDYLVGRSKVKKIADAEYSAPVIFFCILLYVPSTKLELHF